MADDAAIPRDEVLCPAGELALDLTSKAVRLLARGSDGSWAELCAVSLSSGTFRAGIDALRREAEARGATEVTLLLPPEQILVRRFVLKRGGRDRAEALRRLADETGRRAGELSVALSPADDGELVTVLGVPSRTVAEACDYAARWGFRPDRVSTRLEAERFGDDGPAFEPPQPTRPRFTQATSWAAAAALMLALGLGVWGSYSLLPRAEGNPVAAEHAPGELRADVATMEAESGNPPVARQALHQAKARRTEGEPARATVPVVRAAYSPAKGVLSPDAARPEGFRPAKLAPVAADRPPAATSSPTAPERRDPEGRPQATAPAASADSAALLAGIGRIRADGLGASQPDAMRDAMLADAGRFAPSTVPVQPAPRPGDAEESGLKHNGEAEGSDVPGAETSNSRLAVAEAPRPLARPDRPKRVEQAAAPSGVIAPQVRAAAARQGIPLDSASLIGVFDLRSGRQALLRMPSGDYQRVARGDTVAGWQVSMIGQDAMRLTRDGESRTLLLVTR